MKQEAEVIIDENLKETEDKQAEELPSLSGGWSIER